MQLWWYGSPRAAATVPTRGFSQTMPSPADCVEALVVLGLGEVGEPGLPTTLAAVPHLEEPLVLVEEGVAKEHQPPPLPWTIRLQDRVARVLLGRMEGKGDIPAFPDQQPVHEQLGPIGHFEGTLSSQRPGAGTASPRRYRARENQASACQAPWVAARLGTCAEPAAPAPNRLKKRLRFISPPMVQARRTSSGTWPERRMAPPKTRRSGPAADREPAQGKGSSGTPRGATATVCATGNGIGRCLG